MSDPRAHWERVYTTKAAGEVSWFQSVPATSLRLVRQAAEPAAGPVSVLDVGAGASTLVDLLLANRITDVTVLDASQAALDLVAERLGELAGRVTRVCADLLGWSPVRTYTIWHDRAVFHFLTEEADRTGYVALATAAVEPGGALVIATFAADGPTSCSGLPTARYDAAELATQFTAAFVLEHAEREEHRTPSGGIQPFTWVVLRRAS